MDLLQLSLSYLGQLLNDLRWGLLLNELSIRLCGLLSFYTQRRDYLLLIKEEREVHAKLGKVMNLYKIREIQGITGHILSELAH